MMTGLPDFSKSRERALLIGTGANRMVVERN